MHGRLRPVTHTGWPGQSWQSCGCEAEREACPIHNTELCLNKDAHLTARDDWSLHSRDREKESCRVNGSRCFVKRSEGVGIDCHSLKLESGGTTMESDLLLRPISSPHFWSFV